MYTLVPRLAPAQGKGESLGTMLTYLPKGFSVEKWRKEGIWREGEMCGEGHLQEEAVFSPFLRDYQQEAYSACTNT